jgi:hypothetical protein
VASFLASGATLTLPCSLSRLLAATFLLALGSTVSAQTATAHFSGAMNTIPTVQPSDAAGGIAVDDSVGGMLVSLNGGAPVPLSQGQATLTMIPNVAGTHTITAHYEGVDASFAGSTGQASLMVQ